MKKIEIQWDYRYSETMEDDNIGRWARVAYAGKFVNGGFFRRKVSRWEIAWIKKLVHKGKIHFVINYYFPTNSVILFPDLEAAKKEVEKNFRWFIKMCV